MNVEERPPRKRGSGAHGDADLWGDEDLFQIGSAREEDDPMPTRTVWVRVKVRFELLPR